MDERVFDNAQLKIITPHIYPLFSLTLYVGRLYTSFDRNEVDVGNPSI